MPTLRSTATSLTLTGTEPAGAAQGDLLIAYVKGTGNNNPIVAPAGWSTLDARSIAFATPRYVGIYYLVRGASAPALTWSGPSGANIGVECWQVGTFDAGSPINAWGVQTDPSDSTPDSPSIATTAANCTLVAVSLSNASQGSLVAQPAGMTTTISFSNYIHTARQDLGAAGPTGVRTWSLSGSTYTAEYSLAVAPLALSTKSDAENEATNATEAEALLRSQPDSENDSANVSEADAIQSAALLVDVESPAVNVSEAETLAPVAQDSENLSMNATEADSPAPGFNDAHALGANVAESEALAVQADFPPARLRIDVYDSAGIRLGAGPIASVLERLGP